MNQTFKSMNRELGRGIGNEARMQALIAEQRNNKRTVIDPDQVDLTRGKEIISLLAHEDENLGTIISPIPYKEIADDTDATLQMVMHALGLYTFPTKELTDWLHSEIDDDPELEPHSAIEICAGTGWIGRTLGIPTTDSRMQERDEVLKGQVMTGYAGGINPDNVADKLAYLLQQENKGDFWIDMESGVRTDDWFDIEKVSRVLTICKEVMRELHVEG